MVTRKRGSGCGVDRLEIVFDDERLIADAGLVLPALLCERLGAERVVDAAVSRDGAPAIGAAAGSKALSVCFAMLAGADSIDDCDRLRAGATEAVLPVAPRAATTLGNWLRGFSFGQVRQLDAAAGELLARAWRAGARPERLLIDLDSSISEVHGHRKRGAEYGHTRTLGYHPLFASSAETGEVLHTRLRRGGANTQYGVKRFFEETIARCRRAGHQGGFLVRADAGFVNYDLFPRSFATAAASRLRHRCSLGYARPSSRSPTRRGSQSPTRSPAASPRSPRPRSRSPPSTAAAHTPCPSGCASSCGACSTTTPATPSSRCSPSTATSRS